MRDRSYQDSTDFLARFFGGATEHAVELRSFENDSGAGTGKPLFGRDMELVVAHCRRWDMEGRGMFFGTCTRLPGVSKGTRAHLSECRALWVDIDCVKQGLGTAEAISALHGLPFLPSVVIDSGGGLHAYWLLNEAIDVSLPPDTPTPTAAEAEIVAVLKQLAGVLAGDTKVCDLARVMRLPGTHNTKPEVMEARGSPALVGVIEASWATYEFSDLVDWLDYQRPMLKAPAAIEADPEDPYLAASKRMGFKPSVDVERALSEMSYLGQGDTAIHQTQLRVSASLVTQGVDVDEVVAVLIEATRAAAGDAGRTWNWQREEAAIRRMATDAKTKFGARETSQVVNLAEQRTKREEARANGTTGAAPAAKAKSGDKASLHVTLGQTVIEGLEAKGIRLLVTGGEIWRYIDGMWSNLARDERQWLDVTIQQACDALGLTSTNKLISETRNWILRQPALYRDDVPWDDHGMIPTESGLLDQRTMTLHAPVPEHYATWRVNAEYRSDAACPHWLQMLVDFFGDRVPEERAACISLLQEIMGMSLLEDKPRALTRALVLEGASETGKSKVIEVMSGITNLRPISTPLDALASTHGMMEFARRAPWVLHEAFAQGKWHMSSTVKAILTGDPVQINIKNGPIQTKRIRSPIFWGTNHPPQFKEATKAIVNRLIVIGCRTIFAANEPVGVAKIAREKGFSEPSEFILKTEMPGLLAWAVEGCRRALARGHFQITNEMQDALDAIRDDSNLVAGFVKECVEYTPSGMVSTQDFSAAFSIWWQQNKGEDRNTPSSESIGKAVASLGERRICCNPKEMRDNSMRYYGGINLNLVGLDFWEATASSDLASGKKARLSSSKEQVNKVISPSWLSRPSVRTMLKAHEPSGDSSVTVIGDSDSSPANARDRRPRF